MIRSMDVLSASRADRILSKYRPIAPKPQFFSPQAAHLASELQPKPPCRARKRNRGGAAELSFPAEKRAKAQSADCANIPNCADLVTLPPLQTLQAPPNPPAAHVIVPRPVRPVGSSIRLGCFSEAPQPAPSCSRKKPEEVEAEVEAEALPSVVSDSNNRVRIANSAYKELVGQPECPWLHSVAASRRLSGEVMLDLADTPLPLSPNGFSCRARIEWGSDGKKTSVNAVCDVIRLSCDSKDYKFTWRFRTDKP